MIQADIVETKNVILGMTDCAKQSCRLLEKLRPLMHLGSSRKLLQRIGSGSSKLADYAKETVRQMTRKGGVCRGARRREKLGSWSGKRRRADSRLGLHTPCSGRLQRGLDVLCGMSEDFCPDLS